MSAQKAVCKGKDPEDFEEFYIEPDEPVFTSGVVSRLLGMPVWVLKQLDKENIVSPPREERCTRMYSKRELKQVERCWFYMHKRHVKINGLKVILEMEEKMIRMEEDST